MSAAGLITAPQGDARVPKAFQQTIIDSICATLQRPTHAPCLLRSPTGSGKTYMLTRVLQRMCSAQPTLWLWFVPYVNLVAQTVDSIDSEGAGLSAVALSSALNEQPIANLVLISTVQGVASAKGRAAGYGNNEDDERRSLAAYIANAQAAGLTIGLVVDEAHIALDNATEFGKFVLWLKADYLVMASATPRDERLLQFIHSAGKSHFETFSASRNEVVAARLNKKYLQSVTYNLSDSMLSVTDLKLTVLRRAWRRNQKIEQELRARGLNTVPLMLVQVSNGKEPISEAHDFLMRELKIAAHAIGIHSSDEPDPVMMAAIANDTSKQVLIFKQSAGTGFDAPRAFVLASTKPVNDADFATQFIGRVMRVAPELQYAFPQAAAVPPDLDTAYVFLANASAQAGFAAAAQAIQGIKSQLDGQIAELVVRSTADGGVVITNRDTNQAPMSFDLGQLATRAPDGTVVAPPLPPTLPAPTPGITLPAAGSETAPVKPLNPAPTAPAVKPKPVLPVGETGGLFADEDDAAPLPVVDELDEPIDPVVVTPARAPKNSAELYEALGEAQLRSFPRRKQVAQARIPTCFITEKQPVFDTLTLDVRTAVQNLAIDSNTRANAVKAALNLMTEQEISTQLFDGEAITPEKVQVITDQEALLERTRDALEALGLEEEDCTEVIHTLSKRLVDAVEDAWAFQVDAELPSPQVISRQARQAACWVIHKQFANLEQALQSTWADRAKEEESGLLPEALLLPASVQVQSSPKNIYGIYYPSMGATAAARDALSEHNLPWFKSATYMFGDSAEFVGVACIDAAYEFNPAEKKLAEAFDRAEFVAWWHRNPDRKPFSVALLRGDSKNFFYPDFIVCLTHMPGDAPLMRLVDPKHDTKDASRKAQHQSRYYGKVLFLTEDVKQFKIVNDDGSIGDVVDYDDLNRLKAWMRGTEPKPQVATF